MKKEEARLVEATETLWSCGLDNDTTLRSGDETNTAVQPHSFLHRLVRFQKRMV
jgi:hypothetical protein